MNYIKFIIFFCFINIAVLKGQEFYVSGGMGLNYISMEKLNDYLHYNWNFGNRRDDVHSAIEFYALVGTNFYPDISLETSFGYSLNSFSNNFGIGIYQLEYTFYFPELNFLYNFNYTHYGLQIGFGFGYILGGVNETQPNSTYKISEETKGFNFRLISVLYTALSNFLFVELGVNYRKAFLNDLFLDNFKINHQPYESLNLSFNSLGIKLGMRYQL